LASNFVDDTFELIEEDMNTTIHEANTTMNEGSDDEDDMSLKQIKVISPIKYDENYDVP
jgi:hypothetical protein